MSPDVDLLAYICTYVHMYMYGHVYVRECIRNYVLHTYAVYLSEE